MAQIPQINNPITSKNYNYSPRQQDANTEPFDIVKLTGVGSAGVNSDSAAKSRLEMGNRELIPLRVAVAKDPTLAVEMLKDLLNVEVLNQALITGHTELYGSLENLAKEIYVTPDKLVDEIVNQEQQNTMFSGHEFYDVLREVAQTTTDPNTKEIIGGLLKSINFAQNRDEILGALRANLKFLSEYYSPNEKLSEKLLNLSKEWGADDAENYFDYLKSETLSILKDVSGSLLNDDKTQMLIPLITHNLSRYNNSPYMCKEYFNLLLTQISSGTLRESLKNSFNRLYSAIFDKKPMQNPNNSKTMEQVGSMDENLNQNYQPKAANDGRTPTQPERMPDYGRNYPNQERVPDNGRNYSNSERTPDDLRNYPDQERLPDDRRNYPDQERLPDDRREYPDQERLSDDRRDYPDQERVSDNGGKNPNPERVSDNGRENPNPERVPNNGRERYESEVPNDGERNAYRSETVTDNRKQPAQSEVRSDYERQDFQSATMPKDERQVPINNYTTNSSQNQPLSLNSEVKNLTFVELKNEIQHIVKKLGNEFVENADNSRPIFDSEGDFIGLQPRGPIYDDDGNKVGYRTQPFLFDDDGEILENIPNKLYDEYGNEVKPDNSCYDEEGNILSEAHTKYRTEPYTDPYNEQNAEPEPREIPSWHKALNKMMSDRGYMQELKASGYNIEHIVSAYNRGRISGTDAVKTIIKGLFVDSPEVETPQLTEQLNLMEVDLSKVNTMQELIDDLNFLLRDLPDIPLRERLYGVFVDIIDKMAVKSELPQRGIRPPVSSTLDNLTEFIQNNINNPALKSLDSFNAANLLQSLLNAPGVFTPLAHYILPLQVQDTRAFGELWVDNDENNPNNTPGTQRNYHLFLTFDVESIGRFEVDMYALGEEVNLSLLYPPRFEKEIDPMKERLTKIIRNSGYQARTFETAPLKKPHNLVEVFPKITDKRTSLNKRI